GLPWSFVWSGASGNPIYLGVDQTWFGGASWTRPVLNMDNPLSTARPSSCRYDDSSITTLDLHSNANITADNLEFTGKCWAGGAAPTGPEYFYSNVIRHTNECVGIWAKTVSNTFYFFNNVSWHYRENTDGTSGTDGTNCYMIPVNLGSTSPNACIYKNTSDWP